MHVVGAGPVGLMLAALLQSTEGLTVRLYEKRGEYTRTRMVQLAPYLVADSVESYRADAIDGDSVAAIFDPSELDEGLAFRQSIPSGPPRAARELDAGVLPAQHHRALPQRPDRRARRERRGADRGSRDGGGRDGDAGAGRHPHRLDGQQVTPPRSPRARRRRRPEGANTLNVRLEYALVVTFLYGQPYDCNEYCKYYKNLESPRYKFIPMVSRTHYDGSVSHVTGIVNISADEYEAMPTRFDGQWLRDNFPGVAESMDRFIGKIKEETQGEILGELEIVRIPLDLYRARNATSRRWLTPGKNGHPFAGTPVFLAGDSAIGSPYFQSISLGFECAMYLAGLVAQREVPVVEMLDRYELYSYKQWLRVYMRSKTIKHNKDLFESLDDPLALLEKLHIY